MALLLPVLLLAALIGSVAGAISNLDELRGVVYALLALVLVQAGRD